MEPFKIGRYQATAEIGRGGMATVYRAYDAAFEREVAIKVLPRQFLHDPTFRARFNREAKIIGALEHVAIVPVYDFGEEDGQPYLVMRLMMGGSLEDRIRQGRIPLAETARILAHIAPALDEAHALGVIHRDLKPANILFDQRGEPFLADFGIARLVKGPTLTSQYATVGTPAYMSPEQGRGDPDVDGRSDLYSLGAILFEMLSGRVPYEAETPTGQIIKHITDPIPNILELCPDFPPECQVLINCAMAKLKDDRFSTVTEMAQALMTISQGRPLLIQPAKSVLAESPSAAIQPAQAPASGGAASGGPATAGPAPMGAASKGAASARPTFLGWRMTPRVWIGLGALMLLSLLAGVGVVVIPAVFPKSTPVPSTTPSPTLTQTATSQPTAKQASLLATQLPSRTSTCTPTASYTPLPSPTFTPAPTETGTLTPLPVAVVNVDSVYVRAGPGIVYPALITYHLGREVQVIGRNPAGTWLAFMLPDKITLGWISLSMVKISVDVMSLPEVRVPPTPTAPNIPTPTRSRSSPKATKTTRIYP